MSGCVGVDLLHAQVPNQALHVAGAAHKAGFPNVIAAALPVRDSAAAALVKELYQALPTRLDRAADAVPEVLDRIVDSLRLDPTTGPDPLSWAPYAHFSDGLGS